jgi:hypothetical protein
MLRLALVDAALIPGSQREAIRGDALAELAKAYLVTEAVMERVARWIKRVTKPNLPATKNTGCGRSRRRPTPV